MNKPTLRDLKLLDLLAKYEVLSSKLIRDSRYPKSASTNFFRRIRQLEKSKFIKTWSHERSILRLGLDNNGKSLCGIEDLRRISEEPEEPQGSSQLTV